MKSKVDTDLTRCDVGYHLGDKEWAELRAIVVVLSIVHHLVLESLDTTDADAINDTHTVLVYRIKIHLRIGHSLHSSSHTELRAAIHLARFLAVKIVGSLEVFHLTSKLRSELGSIEQCNRSSTALAGQQVGPRLFSRVAYWGERTHSRYNYSI